MYYNPVLYLIINNTSYFYKNNKYKLQLILFYFILSTELKNASFQLLNSKIFSFPFRKTNLAMLECQFVN